MFPIRDHNPSNRTPFVTWALIAMNVVVFLAYFPSLSGSEAMLSAFFDQWALVPREVLAGTDQHTIVTSMFLHGGWMHLIGNMLFLYIFGDNLEDLLGHVGFLLFYLASGVAAAGGQILADPYSPIPMVGASGAIAGVMGGYLLLFPRARIDVLVIIFFLIKVFTIPAWLMLGIWFALQLFNGLSMDVAGGGVAYWAHAGGFAAGLILILPAWLRRGGPAWWGRTHGKPPHDEVNYVVERGRRSPIPVVRRVPMPRDADRPLSDLSRIPRAGSRRTPRSPWSGGRD
ncbi:rhomboid family serine protease [Roseibacterium elongatum DSM 19469]|uniref:Rhomboid family serine protease n=1 Tax=Roseicyclus elongatus DSM 19469 TaxID=1294273 RepID=W8S1H5_9RHOB|nr:rhomboid family intramembrane serine protease [Roseibacterium elongatum]AHM02581.1 rhomboid family serine protease [Roseibacterium elongatum DSM 19469]